MARSRNQNSISPFHPEATLPSRAWLGFFLASYALLALVLMARVPLALAPDEAAHWEYVQHLATLREFPVFRATMIPPQPGYEFHQPPLYYLLCAPLWAATGAGVQNYGCRLVSLLCGLATIWVIWQAARTLFPSRSQVPILATGLAALSPLLVGTGASSNNDALGTFICAVLFWRVALLFDSSRETVWWRDAIWIGVWAGLGVLTKNTCLVVSLVAFCALWTRERNAGDEFNPVASWRAVGVALGAMFLVSSWWLARNQMLYGDPLAYGMFSAAADAGTPGPAAFQEVMGVGLGTYWRNLLIVLFCTAWGILGAPTPIREELRLFAKSGMSAPEWPIALAMLICAVASLALVLGALQARRKYLQGNAEIKSVWRVANWWSVGIGLGILAWFSFASAHFSGGQARYLLPILLPFCVLGARGWMEIWGEKRAFWAAIGLGLTLLALNGGNIMVWRTLV